MAKKSASFYAEVSRTAPLSQEFQAIRRAATQDTLNFARVENELFNSTFAVKEIKTTLTSARDAAPNPNNFRLSLFHCAPEAALEEAL